MALVVKDRVQETGTANTTVSFTLSGAVSGFQSFSAIGNGNTTFYAATDASGNWEVGVGTYSTTGPTLTRTAILSSSNSGSAVTFDGGVSVFVTYPSEDAVYSDGTNIVGPSNIPLQVSNGGTGVIASSGANSVVLRDANQNISVRRVSQSTTTTSAAGGTTNLDINSSYWQALADTGSQTYVLPDATSLQVGWSYVFDNDATGTLTVKDYGGTTLDVVAAGGYSLFFLEDTSTVAGHWTKAGLIPAEVNWGTNSLDLGGSTAITNGVWNGTPIASGYGGTGLTTFTGANSALYSTSSSALTAGTLPVPAGGTGQTTFAAGYIPYGNTTAALQSSAALQFNGTYLVVGGTTPLSGATNPITAFSSTANNYVQTYTYNANSGSSASADFVAYGDNSTDSHGWTDFGFTSSTYNDATYSITGPNESYVLGSAPSGAGATGNLVYATDSTGSANAHQWYVGGFNQAKGAWKMQLTSTGLQLANALAVSYGGTGAATLTGYVKGNGTSAMTASSTIPGSDISGDISGNAGNVTGTVAVANGGTGATSLTANNVLLGNGTSALQVVAPGTSGNVLTSDGTTWVSSAPTGGVTSITGTANQVIASGSTGAITLSLPQSIATTSNVQFGSFGVGTAASGTSGEIRATNNVTAYYSSDRNLKENIQDVPNVLEVVTAIGSKTFDWTDEYIAAHGGEDGYFVKKSDFGVIAQDVQAVFPQAVRTREDGTLAVDYEKLSTLAFGAIKELLKRVEALEAK